MLLILAMIFFLLFSDSSAVGKHQFNVMLSVIYAEFTCTELAIDTMYSSSTDIIRALLAVFLRDTRRERKRKNSSEHPHNACFAAQATLGARGIIFRRQGIEQDAQGGKKT